MLGAACGVLTAVPFAMLVIALLYGRSLTTDDRFCAAAVVAFGMALSFSFLGGHAAAKGAILLPSAKTNPLEFAVAGATAVFIMVMLSANWLLYVC